MLCGQAEGIPARLGALRAVCSRTLEQYRGHTLRGAQITPAALRHGQHSKRLLCVLKEIPAEVDVRQLLVEHLQGRSIAVRGPSETKPVTETIIACLSPETRVGA